MSGVTTTKGIAMETRLLYIFIKQRLRFLVLKSQKLRLGDIWVWVPRLYLARFIKLLRNFGISNWLATGRHLTDFGRYYWEKRQIGPGRGLLKTCFWSKSKQNSYAFSTKEAIGGAVISLILPLKRQHLRLWKWNEMSKKGEKTWFFAWKHSKTS